MEHKKKENSKVNESNNKAKEEWINDDLEKS